MNEERGVAWQSTIWKVWGDVDKSKEVGARRGEIGFDTGINSRVEKL